MNDTQIAFTVVGAIGFVVFLPFIVEIVKAWWDALMEAIRS